ncbi:MoaD/ThiS family protein [Cellulophaga sp. E16_2]|uniref:Molybdopterin synthase sulfur carrier subunit n=1 Tax=Cellulophaga algicola (strain DSM 14237 / IC166 / ACAM 630) TaxID=688270 RepID=E6XC18_CELAD|nr:MULTISPECIES: MoaD/ThiS family protein [Cellulophaga]ADV50023.1 thiamineS protein [Cellulophaga algicola DSM 14237]MBO0592397.1 MoaD/ThiS family protein [Cellulophaga sp. E16_2]
MKVLLFGIAKDIIGASEYEVPTQPKPPSTVKELKDVLVVLFPEFSKLSSFAIAVNSEYAGEEVFLHLNDEIAIIPPVSGG